MLAPNFFLLDEFLTETLSYYHASGPPASKAASNPGTPAKDSPRQEQEHEQAEQDPAAALDECLQVINLRSQYVSKRAERGVPYRRRQQFETQKAPVAHAGHAGGERHERT